MIVRLATIADIEAILALVKQVVPLMQASGNLQWDERYPNRAVFEQDIAQNQLWVVELEGRVAGIAALTTDQEPEYAQVGWDITEPAIVTHRLAVDPHFQGRGVAKALLQQAELVALDRRIPFLRIDTNTENQTTQQLFSKLGYQLAGEIGLSFRPGLRFYCYQKTLPKAGADQ